MDVLISKLQDAYNEVMSIISNNPHRDDIITLTGILNNINSQIDHANTIKSAIEQRSQS